MQDDDGNTSLIGACECGHFETARALLDHGTNMNHQNKVKSFTLQQSNLKYSVIIVGRRDYHNFDNLNNIVDGLLSSVYIKREWLC